MLNPILISEAFHALNASLYASSQYILLLFTFEKVYHNEYAYILLLIYPWEEPVSNPEVFIISNLLQQLSI